MFLDNRYNSEFYDAFKPQGMFYVIRKSWIIDFVNKWGYKILATKKLCDSLDIKGSLYDFTPNQIKVLLKEVQMPEKFWFEREEITLMKNEFTALVENVARPVFSAGHDVMNHKTYYYVFNGNEYGWADSKEFYHLSNLERELGNVLAPFAEGYENYFANQLHEIPTVTNVTPVY